MTALPGPDGNRPVIIVDNTMLGPIYQVPLAHGADLVVTSLTKYVGGHSDLIAGGCSGAAAMLEPIRGMRTILGTMCDPHTGWLLMRSLETLKLRMTAAAEGAHKVAAFLNSHPKVASVWYLGFLPEGHPDRPVFERQCKGPGSNSGHSRSPLGRRPSRTDNDNGYIAAFPRYSGANRTKNLPETGEPQDHGGGDKPPWNDEPIRNESCSPALYATQRVLIVPSRLIEWASAIVQH